MTDHPQLPRLPLLKFDIAIGQVSDQLTEITAQVEVLTTMLDPILCPAFPVTPETFDESGGEVPMIRRLMQQQAVASAISAKLVSLIARL